MNVAKGRLQRYRTHGRIDYAHSREVPAIIEHHLMIGTDVV